MTNLSDAIAEINPLWCPVGNWIAFTAIDLKAGYMTVYIVRPDGGQLTPLAVQRAEDQPADNIDAWGKPNLAAVQWSQDGQYLWLYDGHTNAIEVARQRAGKWVVQPVVGIMGSTFGVLFKAFRGPWAAYILDDGDPQTIELRNLQGQIAKTWILREGVEVLWMNW